MKTQQPVIYVAGNPHLYPLEYYDPESQCYQGAIPEFLQDFAQTYGYDLRYLEPGETDRRQEQSRNQQVDLISGCLDGEWFAHISGDPITILTAQVDGEWQEYQLCLTQVSPAPFQAQLREYAAMTSLQRWTGALLETTAAHAPVSQIHPAAAAGLGFALAVVLCTLIMLVRLAIRARRRRQPAPPAQPDAGLASTESLEQRVAHLAQDQSGRFHYLCFFHLPLAYVGHLWGQEQEQAFLSYSLRTLADESGSDTPPTRLDAGAVVLKRFDDRQSAQQWAAAAVEKLRAFPLFGNVLSPGIISAGVYPVELAHGSFRQALFHARQCALMAAEKKQPMRMCGSDQCLACQERWKLLSEFPQALASGQFFLYVQFFVNAHTFQVVGGESLSRWVHPQLGTLPPDHFIPPLEQAGYISILDYHGLERSCVFLEQLNQRKINTFFLSCNFSRITFSQPDFPAQCIKIIDQYSFFRKLLILEATESQQLDAAQTEQMLRNIQQLRKYGVRVIFDDFGTGFSSVYDLQTNPMDGLKLDKELVDNMDTSQGRIILNSLVETGHRMGMTILAEGVEKDSQITTLQKLGCDVLQGFRFYRPLPAEEAMIQILEKLGSTEASGH